MATWEILLFTYCEEWLDDMEFVVLRACLPEEQAEVIHAISPISVKLG